jgi:hypothetical protein
MKSLGSKPLNQMPCCNRPSTGNKPEKRKTSYCNSDESIICRFAGTPRQNMCSVIQMQTGLSTSSSASSGIKEITIKNKEHEPVQKIP